MSYRVRLTREAELQLISISDYIAKDSAENARRWRVAIRQRMGSLKNFPERHEIAYAAREMGRDIRHTFYGVYRILYVVEGDSVIIITIRHGARRPLTIDEVRRLG